jgi:hypothetical protein
VNVPKPLNILFIGNSHNYYNFMPQLLVELVNAVNQGLSVKVEQLTGKGVSLEWHWNNSKTRGKICAKNWDCIVLQERSGGPLEQPASFETHAQLLYREIKRQGAQTILYMTWANRSRPETQDKITEAYERVARKTGAIVVPVGLAWKRALQLQPDINLYHDDGRHANPTGSYLAACVFYAVLCRSTPEGLPCSISVKDKRPVVIDGTQALFLQKVAFEAVKVNL